MASTNPTIPARAQRARRNNRQNLETLSLQLRMTKSMLEILAHDSPASVFSRSQRLRMADVAQKHGATIEDVMRRAVTLWLDVEAPVYMARSTA